MLPGYTSNSGNQGFDFSDGIQFRVRGWDEIDQVDFWIDVGGIGCDVVTIAGVSLSGPWGYAIEVPCTAIEIAALGKTVADLGQGDPTGSGLQIFAWNVYVWSDVISNGARAVPIPVIGITSNVISLAINWIAIE